MSEAPAGSAEALKNRGNELKGAGDLAGAVESYRRALEAQPDYAAALYNLGVSLRELGSFEEAEATFRRLIALDARDVDALFNLGALLRYRSSFAEAAEVVRRAVNLAPGNAHLWFYLGELGVELGTLESRREAEQCAVRALELEPGLAEAHNLLGLLLQDQGRLDRAVAHYRRATELSGDDPVYRSNLGCALGLMEAFDEAVTQLRRATELAPDFLQAQINLGQIHAMQGKRELALGCLEKAHRLAPDNAQVTASLLFESQYVCDWSRFEELSALRRRNVTEGSTLRIDPFSLLSIPSTRREQLIEARSYARLEQGSLAVQGGHAEFRFARAEKPRLTIGYLSGDFYDHAVTYLASELFELHDRGRFELCAYSYGPADGSPARRRVERAFERFRDVRSLPHGEAAATVHRDGVDILVDLKGYTTHARPAILALRPAPIQVNYLGYPGTMGAEFIDYLVGDAFVTPFAHEADYSEKLVLMPASYQVNDRRRPIAPTPARQALGLPQHAFVFCCFNQAYKILPVVFDAWMRVLKAVPDSVLWLLESNDRAVDNLRREAAARGVEPQRLVIAPKRPLAEHLGRLRAADLFIDTLPYNAHTTTSDALWAGVPVVTCPGDTFPSRVAGSLLRAVGLPELVTESLEHYEALAIRLAHDRDGLQDLRERLAAGRDTAALFDTPAFVDALEHAYELMWRRHAAGLPPERIDLS